MNKDEPININFFDHYEHIPQSHWDNMLKKFEIFPDYQYRGIDTIKVVYGYNLCKTHIDQWQLYPIALDIKDNSYHIKNKEKTPVPSMTSLIQNNFIFCINGIILEYIQKNTQNLIKEMCLDLNFQITRLTISDRLELQNKAK